MKLGFSLLNNWGFDDPQQLVDLAVQAEELGIDSVWVHDHVFNVGHVFDRIGGRPYYEPLTLLTFVAARTRRVRLGTSVLVLPYHNPVRLAKAAATLDVLSGGRLDLGVGVGWQREEYEAAGLDFRTRGRQLDLTLEVCQTLWREPRADVELPGLAFQAIHMMPKPVRPGGVPLWISGRCNERVARRLARFGSGWIPWGEDAADLPTSIPRMREAVAVAGGDTDGIQVAGTLPAVRREDRSVDLDATMDRVLPLVEAGVTDFRAHLPVPSVYDEAVDSLRDIADAFHNGTR
jgi:probable F420-dependent oxidoreductase